MVPEYQGLSQLSDLKQKEILQNDSTFLLDANILKTSDKIVIIIMIYWIFSYILLQSPVIIRLYKARCYWRRHFIKKFW